VTLQCRLSDVDRRTLRDNRGFKLARTPGVDFFENLCLTGEYSIRTVHSRRDERDGGAEARISLSAAAAIRRPRKEEATRPTKPNAPDARGLLRLFTAEARASVATYRVALASLSVSEMRDQHEEDGEEEDARRGLVAVRPRTENSSNFCGLPSFSLQAPRPASPIAPTSGRAWACPTARWPFTSRCTTTWTRS